MGWGLDLGLETSCTVLVGVLWFWEGGGEETQVEGERGGQLGLGGCRRLWSGSSGEEEPVQVTGHCRNTRVGLCPAGNARVFAGDCGLPGFIFPLLFISLCVLRAKCLSSLGTSFPLHKWG